MPRHRSPVAAVHALVPDITESIRASIQMTDFGDAFRELAAMPDITKSIHASIQMTDFGDAFRELAAMPDIFAVTRQVLTDLANTEPDSFDEFSTFDLRDVLTSRNQKAVAYTVWSIVYIYCVSVIAKNYQIADTLGTVTGLGPIMVASAAMKLSSIILAKLAEQDDME